MKTIKIVAAMLLVTALTITVNAQTKTETFKVSGNCGMCKSKIEKAAKEAGAKEASWDADSKQLTVTYKNSSTSAAKIQQKIADVGYDNVGFKATTEAYNKLHGCCKYDRQAANEAGEVMDCCKDGKCSKEGHDGKDCCKKTDHKMDCCKDGKCSKEGHDGKDCCKKEDKGHH